ncbi:MAG TPA: ATP-binding protein [Anaerovoracaceae bacterium]|nr:ATP-binding protein [Anaerovoracaceae bacterium]
MKFSLKSKLSLAMAMVVLLTVAVISFLSNYLIQDQFKDYVTHQQQKSAKQIVDSISAQYSPAIGSWNTGYIHTIGMNALYEGYIVKVYDESGTPLWDAYSCDMNLCVKTMDDISHRMVTEYPSLNGSVTTETFPMVWDSNEIGTVSIESYGPFFFSEDDFLFLDSLNRILIGIGGLSLLISVLTGILLARRLTRPILKTVEATQDIAAGRYGTRIRENSGTVEVDRLIDSINHLAQSLEKQEDLRRQLSADVAHELRTPLTTVQTHMEAMLEGVWEPTRERLEGCYDEMNRLGKLVSDLESLAKVESDNLKLNKTEVSLRELTDKALGSFEKELADRGLSAETAGSCSDIMADRDRISQVLVNLISNAVKYTPDGGKITITLSDTEDSVVFNIRDNGAGIPEEEIPYIFERFYRADKSRNRNTGGSGIGLAIVKSIVTAHGGTVDVESRVNQGSNFIVTLPK